MRVRNEASFNRPYLCPQCGRPIILIKVESEEGDRGILVDQEIPQEGPIRPHEDVCTRIKWRQYPWCSYCGEFYAVRRQGVSARIIMRDDHGIVRCTFHRTCWVKVVKSVESVSVRLKEYGDA